MVYLSDIQQDRVKDFVSHSCFKEVFRNRDFVAKMEENEGEAHKLISFQKRQDPDFINIRPPPIEDLRLYLRPDDNPIIFEDIFVRDVQAASLLYEDPSA
jgi:hypothetical protein